MIQYRCDPRAVYTYSMSDSAIYSVRLRWRPHEDVTKIRKIDIQRTSGDLPTHKELLTGELGLRKVFQPLKNRCRTDVLKFTNNVRSYVVTTDCFGC